MRRKTARLRAGWRRRFLTIVLSLRNILALHAPLLLIDAASTRVQVGVFSADGEARWQTADDDAGTGLFRCIETLAVDLALIRAFAFCDGPGSVLGIRTSAMALRMWNTLSRRPTFAYTSLAVVAHALGQAQTSVIADARRDLWHHYSLESPQLRRLPVTELPDDLVMPDGFRHWSTLPAKVSPVPYALAEWLPQVADAALFREVESPEAFLHEEPSYAAWSPQIHRSPAKP